MLLRIIYEDYKGYHQSPDKENGAPLHDLRTIYPDDIYSQEGARIYGTGEPYDHSAISILRDAKGKPNKLIKVYRAVPKVITKEQHIDDIIRQKRYILKYGKIPRDVNTHLGVSEYYEQISDELDRIKMSGDLPDKIQINPGDWVSISRDYAVLHGRSSLRGNYRILSKTVRAKDLYTEGNSIHEWGYHPSA